MNLTLADFPEFFAHLHGEDTRPFAWQHRLLHHVVDTGRWPEQITAPTGAGKTSVIDIHVFACALAAAGQAPRLPRRLALVVDRRILVDDQHEHATTLATRLQNTENGGVMARVADALRTLRTQDPVDDDAPLLVTRLRGGIPAGRAWRDDPTGCQILCATPDMWGSRVLFGGYGTSPWARPREAGLLAFDTVAVIDEAQLSRQLVVTARRVAELTQAADHVPAVPGLQVVETTATPDPAAGMTIGVDPADLDSDAVLARRLRTPKPVELLQLPTWPLPKTGKDRDRGIDLFADRTTELRDRYGPTVGCFVNTVTTAKDLAVELQRRGHRVQLVCGRMRPADLDRLRREHPGLLDITGDPSIDAVVTTQSLEVGADLDWTAALTELAPGTAITQRAGRVNRRGLRAETTLVVAVPPADLDERAPTSPYQATDLNLTLHWLKGRSTDHLGMAPIAVASDPAPTHQPRRILLQRPELGDAWSWARTSDTVYARPDLTLWLSDDLTLDTDVGVTVRHGLPHDQVDALQLIRDLPPAAHEVMPTPIAKAQDALNRHFPTDTTPEPDEDDGPAWPLVVRDDTTTSYDGQLRPGDLIVIDDQTPIFTTPAGIPIIDPTGNQTADDVLEAPPSPGPGEVVARLGNASLFDHGDHHKAGLRAFHATITACADGTDSRQARDTTADTLDKLATELTNQQLASRFRAAARLLHSRIKDSDVIIHRDIEDQPLRMIVIDRRKAVLDEEARQQWTPSPGPVSLDQHSRAVSDRARNIAVRLGLENLSNPLGLAGLYHDAGKDDPRFQTVLGAGPDQPALAKSETNNIGKIRDALAASGLPRGWRHEQLSVLRAWPHLSSLIEQDRFLVARLIGTSHGRGRHTFPHTTRDLLTDIDAETEKLVEALFDDGLWDHLIEHTHTIFGTWGCAYLEALLRAADGQVSREGS